MILTYVRCGDDFHSKSGQIVARTANGVRQTYEYDGRGQLLAVKEDGADVERYVYDKAGNMLRKTIRLGRAHTPGAPQYRTTTFTFDGANQLVSSTTDGVTTQYAYDAAGRLVKEGDKAYRYGYLDKVLSVTEGERTYTYDYHVDGQLARADCGNGKAEDFGWDGLALIKRGDERFVNEPHIGGGNPVASSKGMTYFNDMLGTTVGAKSNGKYSAAALTAFGEGGSRHTFFTGKPRVDGLGHAFLMRNYRASLAKWQTADPLGYPDGWNQLVYCNNRVENRIDVLGGWCEDVHHDINETYLLRQGIDAASYRWGTLSLNVLDNLNYGSDWTDSVWAGNQFDSKAYYHAMRSSDQSLIAARNAWDEYRIRLVNSAKSLSDQARAAYRNGDIAQAGKLEVEAIVELGKLLHTYDDSFSPSHQGFQHFSLWTADWHIVRESMSVYESGFYSYTRRIVVGHNPHGEEIYGWETMTETYMQGGYRDFIYNQIRRLYSETVNYVLRQPE